MVRHYYQLSIIALVISVQVQAVNKPQLTGQQAAEQVEKQEKQSEEFTDDKVNKTETKEKDQKQQTVQSTNKQQDTFTPTEEISEDLAVSFPVDI